MVRVSPFSRARSSCAKRWNPSYDTSNPATVPSTLPTTGNSLDNTARTMFALASTEPYRPGATIAKRMYLGERTNVNSHLRILTKQVLFTNFSAEAHGGHATGDFSFALAGPNTTFSTNMQVSGVDMAYLLAQFPEGRGKMTGTMQGNVNVEGEVEHSSNPLRRIHGSGRITVRNGELPTLNQDKNMMKMTRFRNPGAASRPPSSFSSFSADMNLANRRIFSHQINIDFYGIDVQCSGSLGVAGGEGMDYKGVASVLNSQGFFTNLIARISGGKLEKGKLSFPIRVGGTLQNPKLSVVD